MKIQSNDTVEKAFNAEKVIHKLKHYLPAQAPLKDFIHHNTLHAFQNLKFHQAIRNASEILGYRVTLSLLEFRELYRAKRIREDILESVIARLKNPGLISMWKEKILSEPEFKAYYVSDKLQKDDIEATILKLKGAEMIKEWKEKALNKEYGEPPSPRIGSLRANWKRQCQIDLDSMVHPILFRTLSSYLDQGISMWNFPISDKGFLASIKELEQNSFSSFFKRERSRQLLLQTDCEIGDLLKILVGDESLFEQYLYDQQFAHQGWSGMVSTVEDVPHTLLDRKQITTKELVIFELLLEIDALDDNVGKGWPTLGSRLSSPSNDLFAELPERELSEVISIWQEAFEWTYYDEVLEGIVIKKEEKKKPDQRSFQSLFCIDDRECSLRRYIEKVDPACETFGTPGFFSVEFYFQPENGKFYNKLCPWPVTPKFLIKEVGGSTKRQSDIHFSNHTLSLFRGWLIANSLGFWAAIRLFINVFRPAMSPATASSFKHMDSSAQLTIENKNLTDRENDLQIGFTVDEMAIRAEGMLKSIGLVKDFAPLVYIVGHGSSSVNNPHYAAYDCGACSGRAGSVNSRVMCFMLNHPAVRKILIEKSVAIPIETQFVGGLHDTTRDEIVFFDEASLTPKNREAHAKNGIAFQKALDLNSKERSRRFVSINTKQSAAAIHKKILTRSVSLFEPRPELNHATNTLCIVGGRNLTKDLFLDRRAFMNSYDYTIDLEGKLLFNVMKPLGPVCGGINLEYFFSRVDNQKLGAGTKLPHNVMGLFGVANGIDGDLRPGLPIQMIEVHDPIRLLIIVEHFPEVVLQTIQKAPDVYEWFINDWVRLVAFNPDTKELSLFSDGAFTIYKPLAQKTASISDVTPLLEANEENLPVYIIS